MLLECGGASCGGLTAKKLRRVTLGTGESFFRDLAIVRIGALDSNDIPWVLRVLVCNQAQGGAHRSTTKNSRHGFIEGLKKYSPGNFTKIMEQGWAFRQKSGLPGGWNSAPITGHQQFYRSGVRVATRMGSIFLTRIQSFGMENGISGG